MELYLHSPSTPSWRGAQLRKNTGTTLALPFIVGLRIGKFKLVLLPKLKSN
jgi:hypothetical protein